MAFHLRGQQFMAPNGGPMKKIDIAALERAIAAWS